jgi:hypothetical protein
MSPSLGVARVPKPKQKRKRYTREQIDRCLLALLAFPTSEDAARYCREEHGIEVTAGVLRAWRSRIYRDRWVQLAAEHQDQIAQALAVEAETIAAKAALAEHRLLDRLLAEADRIDARDLAGTLRNVTTTKSLNVDKISTPLRGRPSAVVEHRTIDEIARRWAHRLASIDSTAQEITGPEIPASAEDAPAQGEAGCKE